MPKKQYPPDRELAVDPTAGHMLFKLREFAGQAARVVQLPIPKRRAQPLGAGKPHRGDGLENEILGVMQATWLLRTPCKTKPL